MLPTVNTDGGSGLDVRMKAERFETLTVEQGSSPLGWGQESRWSRSSFLFFLAMAKNAVIGRAPDGD